MNWLKRIFGISDNTPKQELSSENEALIARFEEAIRKVEALADKTSGKAEAQIAPMEAKKVTPPSFDMVLGNASSVMPFQFFSQDLIPEGYKMVPMEQAQRRDLYNRLSIASGLGANAGLTQLCGVYEATAPASELMKLSSGGLGSAQQAANGKIIAQKGFVNARVQAFTPMLAFQVLSMITGQYYLQGLKKQLDQINSKLDILLNKIDSAYEGKLFSALLLFKKMGMQDAYTMDDLMLVQMKMDEMLECYFSFVSQMNRVKQQFATSELKKRFNDAWTNKGDVSDAMTKFKEQNLLFMNQMAQAYYQAYSIGELLYAKMLASRMANDADAAIKYGAIIDSYRSGGGSLIASAMSEHKEVLADIKRNVIAFIEYKLDDASSYKDTIRSQKKEMQEEFAKAIPVFENDEIKGIRKMQSQLLQNYDAPRKYLYDCSEPGETYVFTLTEEENE